MDDVKQFPKLLKQRAKELRMYGAAPQAMAIEAIAVELEAILRARDDEVLSISDAAQESGYSVDHLARLIREQKIPNAGRKGAPRVRRRDLPRKPVVQTERDRATEAYGYIEEMLFRDIVTSKHGG